MIVKHGSSRTYLAFLANANFLGHESDVGEWGKATKMIAENCILAVCCSQDALNDDKNNDNRNEIAERM